MIYWVSIKRGNMPTLVTSRRHATTTVKVVDGGVAVEGGIRAAVGATGEVRAAVSGVVGAAPLDEVLTHHPKAIHALTPKVGSTKLERGVVVGYGAPQHLVIALGKVFGYVAEVGSGLVGGGWVVVVGG